MPAPFKQLSREQFAELLLRFPFTRKINAVHMHHTWRPNRAQYRGHETIVAMWRYHTQTMHWQDIAQHISIAPDGSIWLGRDWNLPPASAAGHNGSTQAGPFMFEMIGDFDEGHDAFDGEQRRTALEVIARVQQRFGLAVGTLQLHNMMSNKSCPGTSIDYHTVLHDVAVLNLPAIGSAPISPLADGPFSAEQQAAQQKVREAIEDLQRSSGLPLDPADAEPCSNNGLHDTTADALARGIDLSAADLQALRPHVVNLRMGQFSSDGDWQTAPADVDAIFEQFLPDALQQARAAGRPLRLMLYAHGGLVSEADALAAVRSRIGWWKDNDIYPISFVWETGLAEVLGQMLERALQSRGPRARNLFSDNFSDPLMEAFAHRAGGVQIWNSMKWSAQQASSGNLAGGADDAPGAVAGGAYYVARQLAAFCARHGDAVEVHACGHSAGAIFHAYFVPCALALGVPRIHSLHLLAPAARVDLFEQQLAGRIGHDKGVLQLAMYSMADSYEKNDDCAGIYRKSLLYLIYHALEAQADQAILGLERCVRADAGLKRLFGIGAERGAADVMWADNGLERGRSASRARSHGSFDDDPATMGSVVRRVLGKADADRIVELPALSRGGLDPWRAAQAAWPFYAPDDAIADQRHGKRIDDYAGSAAMQYAGGIPAHYPGSYPAQYAGNYPAQYASSNYPACHADPRLVDGGTAYQAEPHLANGGAAYQADPYLANSGAAYYAGTHVVNGGAAYPARPFLISGMQAPPPWHSGGARRLALCVGIDSYPTAPLGGCVNDARAWAAALARLGFDTPRTLLNGQATRAAIARQLSELVADSKAGDVIAFHYSGHGTCVPDLDGDELGGDTPGTDEAICPCDFADGELLIDDDLRAIFKHLPAGVNLSCFFDCCYSGTITRVALGPRPAPPAAGARARYIEADRELIDKYIARRNAAPAPAPGRAAPGAASDPMRDPMREVVFSACLSSEVAHERNGQGDFSRYALQVLAHGIAGLSNGNFADRVAQAFGAAPSQHAKLYSSDIGRALPFLQALQALQQLPQAPQSYPPRFGTPWPARSSPLATLDPLDLLSAPARSELAAQLARTSQLLAHYH